MTDRPWNEWDAELADTLEHALRIRTRYLTVLDEAPEATSPPQPNVVPGVSSSAAASLPEPNAPVRVGPATANGKSSAGPSGAVALDSLSTGKLRSIVTHAREAHGPHRANWSTRECRAWNLLNARGMAA